MCDERALPEKYIYIYIFVSSAPAPKVSLAVPRTLANHVSVTSHELPLDAAAATSDRASFLLYPTAVEPGGQSPTKARHVVPLLHDLHLLTLPPLKNSAGYETASTSTRESHLRLHSSVGLNPV